MDIKNKKCYICGETKDGSLFVDEFRILLKNEVKKFDLCKDCYEQTQEKIKEKQVNPAILEENLKYWVENYECIFNYNLNDTRPIIIDDSNGKCRFCQKESPEVSFNKKAHAISEMLGNKNLFSNNECDQCNEFFGNELENDLGKYLGIIRTLTQINGKKGVPSYKTKDKKARIDLTNKGFVVQQVIGKEFLDIDNKCITFTFERESYTPIKVYKALVKMALSLLAYKFLENFNETFSWLKDDSEKSIYLNMKDYASVIIERFIPGPRPFNLTVKGFIRKEEQFLGPYYYFILEFGNFSYQIMVPCRKKDQKIYGKKIDFKIFPNEYDFFPSKFGIAQTIKKDMRSEEKTENEKLKMPFKFDKFEEVSIGSKNLDEVFEEHGIILKKRLKPNN